jgi:hypothetical protein
VFILEGTFNFHHSTPNAQAGIDVPQQSIRWGALNGKG